MELTVEQVLLIGVIATALVQVIKWVTAWFKIVEIPNVVLVILCFVISVVLAFLWMAPTLPPIDPNNLWPFINALLQQASAVFGFATLIYAALFKYVLDKLKLAAKDLVAKRLQG